ncbi:hypothetical protein V6N12_069209 [Hibiscus sabdariffa]|uniref:Uncharacterized protein n=1 Tax=Hibiscus sabdariffa TaxID=183260 RepID=A0ABR2FDC3_9ROSI
MPRKLDHVTNCLFLPVQGCQIKSPFLPPLLRAEDVEYESNAPNLSMFMSIMIMDVKMVSPAISHPVIKPLTLFLNLSFPLVRAFLIYHPLDLILSLQKYRIASDFARFISSTRLHE